MDALIEGSSTIRTSVSADLFGANTDVAHHHKDSCDVNGENYGSSLVTLTPPCMFKSKVATTKPKMSILSNQSADIKVGYFGNFVRLFHLSSRRSLGGKYAVASFMILFLLQVRIYHDRLSYYFRVTYVLRFSVAW